MSRSGPVVKVASVVAVAMLAFSSCGASNFGRADAITSLQTSGATLPQATCIAGTLLAMDQLEAADPRTGTTDSDQEALSSANERCVSTEVLPAFEVEVDDVQSTLPNPEVAPPPARLNELQLDEEGDFFEAAISSEELEAQGAAAVEMLMSLGRTETNAECVIDHLLELEAIELLTSPELGLGLDPREASALAVCLSE